MREHRSRRQFIAQGITLAVAAPSILGAPRDARAAKDLPRLVASSNEARQYGYVQNAADSEERADSAQSCLSCRFYEGAPAALWGPCDVFPRRLVAANGWCNSYLKRRG